jgi:hypothetical protein
MTWRQFMVRVRGLSVNSATQTSLRIGHVASSRRVQTMETPEAAQAAFERLFAPPKRRDH